MSRQNRHEKNSHDLLAIAAAVSFASLTGTAAISRVWNSMVVTPERVEAVNSALSASETGSRYLMGPVLLGLPGAAAATFGGAFGGICLAGLLGGRSRRDEIAQLSGLVGADSARAYVGYALAESCVRYAVADGAFPAYAPGALTASFITGGVAITALAVKQRQTSPR